MYPGFAMETLGSNPVEAGRELPPSLRTRRQRVRQKVHTPAYASLNGSSSGQILDLSEIVDISEAGMAIQTSFPLEVQRSVNLCLDLTATRACIHTKGEVIWCDGTGRVGISFPQMPDDALRQLKEWLFVNVMVACVNYRADLLSASSSVSSSATQLAANPLFTNQFAAVAPQGVIEKQSENSALFNWMRQELEPTAPADYTSILTALAAVKREVDALASDLDGALQLLAKRAQTFTRATGAAIALTEGASMICRASSGQDAPGPGARFSIGTGFSGECVRSGQLLRCDDSETDPYVDRESCRMLGIRSIIAVPIGWDDSVIGLLEVFAPEPYAFSTNDPLALKRLAGIISMAVHRAGAPESSAMGSSATEENSGGQSLAENGSAEDLSSENVSAPHSASKVGFVRAPMASVDDEFPVETSADLPLPRFSRSGKILLAAAAATVLFAASWVISPRDFANFAKGSSASASQPLPKASTNPPTPVAVGGVEGLRKLAEQGDPAAQFSMGAHYATGEDVSQDYAEAVRWFTMAAEQGHVVSQATLGAYYWAGRGVPQDLVKAYFWSVLAQAGGDEASKYRVSVLASRMTHAQVAAAEQQANDWIKEHQSVSQNSPAQR
jgi:TPR repeat protein/putative methionine-R-sulfoxide reductase with GAF domain